MATFARSQTNLEEVETTPFAHKYMVKRPRLREAATTTSIDLSANIGHVGHVGHEEPSSESDRIAPARQPSLPEESKVDNPATEKREFSDIK